MTTDWNSTREIKEKQVVIYSQSCILPPVNQRIVQQSERTGPVSERGHTNKCRSDSDCLFCKCKNYPANIKNHTFYEKIKGNVW